MPVERAVILGSAIADTLVTNTLLLIPTDQWSKIAWSLHIECYGSVFACFAFSWEVDSFSVGPDSTDQWIRLSDINDGWTVLFCWSFLTVHKVWLIRSRTELNRSRQVQVNTLSFITSLFWSTVGSGLAADWDAHSCLADGIHRA